MVEEDRDQYIRGQGRKKVFHWKYLERYQTILASYNSCSDKVVFMTLVSSPSYFIVRFTVHARD